jgi:hypothetical protein
MEDQTDQPNSVEISINAKGVYSGKVKSYSKILSEAYSEAVIKATELEELIRQKNKNK